MSTETEMPRYQCHKEVWALKIAAVEGTTLEFVESGYVPRDVGMAYMQKHEPEKGGYFVVYQDGYESFSPAKAFEEGYSAVT